MRIALCQLNPIMGDIAGNTARISDVVRRHANNAIDLFVFPELFVHGYPPRDLLENQWFINQALSALDELCALSRSCAGSGLLTGVALPGKVGEGKGLFNSAVLIADGRILFHQNKSLLPTYDVFDESRYFDPAPEISVFEFRGERLGITVCEDAWNFEGRWACPVHNLDPVAKLAGMGASLLINLSASPFHAGKERLRYSLFGEHAKRHGLPFLFVNQIGGNDELIFDGNSMYFDAEGKLRHKLPAFAEDVRIVDTENPGDLQAPPSFDTIAGVHDALVLGVRDYVRKCGFESVLIGLSGGIDSAVTCAIAVAALGAEKVLGVTMPSRYSSEGSVADSEALAGNLGIELKNIPVERMLEAFEAQLAPHFEGRAPDVTEENLQARIRGTILMSLSNKLGSLLLSTGNKSELAVGYCTLYGDMNGGLAVISDLPKTMVYDVAGFINRDLEIIPQTVLDKEPSAELRPGQKDQDSLPPYDVLDRMLVLLIEEGKSTAEVAEEGFDPETVKWVARAVAANEYKRRQAPPGLKVTPKSFGSGRRFPIAARYER